MRRLIWLLVLCLLPATASWSANTMKYDTLRLGQNEDRINIVLDLGGPAKAKYFALTNPNRFVVDILDTVRTGNKPIIDYSNTPIKHIRSGIRNGHDIRLVLDIDGIARGKAFVIPPSGNKGYRLVIELSDFKPRLASKTTKPTEANGVSVSEAVVVEKNITNTQASAPPVRQIKKQEIVADQAVRDIIVAIDAGHGGIDPGAKGHKGTHEKDVVLAIAQKLAEQIRKEPGMKPLMIRNGDEFISLRKRMDKARMHKADLFVSIHADAFPDRRAKGASVYALSQHGATTEAARMLAHRENESDLVGGVSLDDKDELLASVLLDLSQNATIEASLDVAGRVLKGLKGVGKVHKHRVEQAGFAVLKSPDIPSILVETAFISNPTEENNLRSPQYQHKLASAMMTGVRSYFISNPPPGTRLAAREHVIRRGETLSEIAKEYSVSLKTLRLANDLISDSLRIGQVIQIPTSDS